LVQIVFESPAPLLLFFGAGGRMSEHAS